MLQERCNTWVSPNIWAFVLAEMVLYTFIVLAVFYMVWSWEWERENNVRIVASLFVPVVPLWFLTKERRSLISSAKKMYFERIEHLDELRAIHKMTRSQFLFFFEAVGIGRGIYPSEEVLWEKREEAFKIDVVWKPVPHRFDRWYGSVQIPEEVDLNE